MMLSVINTLVLLRRGYIQNLFDPIDAKFKKKSKQMYFHIGMLVSTAWDHFWCKYVIYCLMIYEVHNFYALLCEFRWDNHDAQVVCRALGMIGGESIGYAYFGQGSGPVLLDEVGCDGSEESLIECNHNDWGLHDCTHDEDAGVICSKFLPKYKWCHYLHCLAEYE